jgi:hypothetical protein
LRHAARLLGLWAAFHFTIDLDARRYDSLVVSTIQAFSAICGALLVRRDPQVGVGDEALGAPRQGQPVHLLCHPFVQAHGFRLLRAVAGGGWVARIGSFAATIAVSLALWEITKRSPLLSRLVLPSAGARPRRPQAVADAAAGQ